MTQNEVNIIKNSVLDATEAYVDARLGMADFVKTQIGVVISNTARNNKYYHKVKCNATSGSAGITYDNVLSVGNIQFPANSVVFLIAPNAQYTNQFILGKLDTSPCNIEGGSIKINNKFYVDSNGNMYVGGVDNTAPFKVDNQGNVAITKGSINIGNGQFIVDLNGNVTCKNLTANNSGTIGCFTIDSNKLYSGNDVRLSANIIACGEAGNGLVGIRGKNNNAYLQVGSSGAFSDVDNDNTCIDGIRIYYNGNVSHYPSGGSQTPDWSGNLQYLPRKTLTYWADGTVHYID